MAIKNTLAKLLKKRNVRLLLALIVGYVVVYFMFFSSSSEGYCNCASGQCGKIMGKDSCNCGCNDRIDMGRLHNNNKVEGFSCDGNCKENCQYSGHVADPMMYVEYDDIQSHIPSGLDWKKFYKEMPNVSNMHNHTNLILPCNME